MSYEYSNSTWVQDKAGNFAYTAWIFIVLLASSIGDSVILIASIKYNAIRVHRIILTYIEQIAVCDIMMSLFWMLPSFVSAVMDDRTFGGFNCSLTVYIGYYAQTTSLFFVCVMTTSRLLIVKYPVRARILAGRRVHVVVAVWIISSSVPIALLITDKDDTYFDYRGYICEYGFTSKSLLLDMVMVIYYYIPLVVIAVTTTLLIHELCKAGRNARRIGASVPWNSTLTVTLTAVLAVVSIIPFNVYSIVYKSIIIHTSGEAYLDTVIYRGCVMCSHFYIMGNFFVYCMAVPSFRYFLRTKLDEAVTHLAQYFRSYLPVSPTGNNIMIANLVYLYCSFGFWF